MLPKHDVPNDGEASENQHEHDQKVVQIDPRGRERVRQLAQLVLKFVELEKSKDDKQDVNHVDSELQNLQI
jgi:hypothetical protein